MKALIDPRFQRVAQLVSDAAVFAVAEPLHWIDVPVALEPYITTLWGYDGTQFLPVVNDPRTESWNGSAVVTKTQAEIDAWDDARLGQLYSRFAKATAAAVIREVTGSFPSAAMADRLKGYFKTAWKALG